MYTNQEMFNKLSELEEMLFYAKNQNDELKTAHSLLRQALVEFQNATGCELQ